jgi:hypothetical protein
MKMAELPRCKVCGKPMWQKHLETCPGPPKKPSDA